MHTRVHQEAWCCWKQAVEITDASFVPSNPTRPSFVIVNAGCLRADVAVKEPSYNTKSENDSRVVLVAGTVGSRKQKKKWSSDQAIVPSLSHIRSAGQTAHGS